MTRGECRLTDHLRMPLIPSVHIPRIFLGLAAGLKRGGVTSKFHDKSLDIAHLKVTLCFTVRPIPKRHEKGVAFPLCTVVFAAHRLPLVMSEAVHCCVARSRDETLYNVLSAMESKGTVCTAEAHYHKGELRRYDVQRNIEIWRKCAINALKLPRLLSKADSMLLGYTIAGICSGSLRAPLTCA